MDDFTRDTKPLFNLPPVEPPQPPKPERSCLQKGAYLLIVLILVAGMMGSAIWGVVWLYDEYQEQEVTAVVPPPPTIALPTRAIAIDGEVVTEVTAVDTPDGLLNRIVYVNRNNQIATIDPDGQNIRLLTDDGRSYIFPAWSPDGQHIASIGGDRDDSVVYLLRDETDSAQQELYKSASRSPIYLYWSPDSQQVSFLAQRGGGMALYLAAVDPAVQSRLLATGAPFYWHWADDSEQLFIHSGFAGPDSQLAFIGTGDGLVGDNLVPPGYFQAPGISHDGRYLAYAQERDAESSWLIVEDTQSDVTQEERHAGLVALSWSPTDNLLAFTSTAREKFDFRGPLRLLNAETGEVTLLSRRTVLAFFWSPDGRYIATISVDLPDEGTIAANSVNKQRVSSKTAVQFEHPELDLMLIEVATGETFDLLSFKPTRQFLSQFLPYFDQYALSHRVWSPTSDALVFPMRRDGDDKIVVVPIDGSAPRELAEGNMPFWSQN